MVFEAHYIDVLKRRILLFLFSIRAAVNVRWWKIKTKRGIKVYGKIYFRRLPGSVIEIGAQCRFNSSSNSNLIGVNRPCMLSTLTREATIKIGDYCGFSGTVIGAFKSITIGNNVNCGANTLITDSDWHPEDSRSKEPLPIIIEDNVWLGANTVILKGVTIGANTLIGINSVVTKSIPANVVAAGNPCRVIREIE